MGEHSLQDEQASPAEQQDVRAMSRTYYLGHEHEALKDMVEKNLDPAQLDDAGTAWHELGATLLEFQAAFSAAANRSAEDWSGVAGSVARGYLTKLGESMGSAGQGFQVAGGRMHAQAEAAERARKDMPEPVRFSLNETFEMLEREADPFALGKVVRRVVERFDEKKRAHEQAAGVMAGYARSLTDVDAAMPAFAPPPVMAAEVGLGPRPAPDLEDGAFHGSLPVNAGDDPPRRQESWPVEPEAEEELFGTGTMTAPAVIE